MPSRFVVCADKQEAQAMQDAGLLWILCDNGKWMHHRHFVGDLVRYYCDETSLSWGPAVYGYLVED